MKVVLTGGGSGGHITPLLAVAHEIRKLDPSAKIFYVGQRGDALLDIPAKDSNIDSVYSVRSGKFRRYHGVNVLKQLFDIPTDLKNLRDFIWVIVGVIQSWFLLRKIRPNIILTSGGFVGVPVGIAASSLKIPYITHDLDGVPGLANRLISRRAAAHAVALPKENYNYPAANTYTVGVPVSAKFTTVGKSEQKKFKEELGVSKFNKMLFITGGGLGAKNLNAQFISIIHKLLDRYNDLVIIHGAGRANEDHVRKQYNATISDDETNRVIVKGFIEDLYRYSGAADVVVSRAGATAIAEFAIQGRACVIIPNPLLTNGHQIKNAEALRKMSAAIILSENEISKDENKLLDTICQLLESPESREQISDAISKISHPNSAHDLAKILINIAS
ncbi:MAG TPA: UDP-N-acetylglucosamine--N-acetylmuramyl-(pentapeptide) pyrophosphoryl-undecaprenol N-acetylglucosamine transferase [Candidatus Saccharimonadales bacterium]|nr:UDP-N-acetylglucosamine--N-acetylmuramyl-(pentapeptide) pyrophosphoryl-undecaprenol N-acetylglucosamine transferase [Candidatus Saccharimonadales bacterium]